MNADGTFEAKKVKGRALKGYVQFIRKKWGNDGLNDCGKAINLDLTNLHDEKWYLNKFAEGLLHWIAEKHGMEYVKMAGRSLSSEVGIVSFAAKLLGIERIMDKAFNEMRDSINFGTVTVEREGHHAIISFDGVSHTEETCVVWQGILEGLYDITGIKGTVEKIECQHSGGNACAYEMKWGKE